MYHAKVQMVRNLWTIFGFLVVFFFFFPVKVGEGQRERGGGKGEWVPF